MLYRWIAETDLPDLHIARGDVIVYNGTAAHPCSVTRVLYADQSTVLNLCAAGALTEIAPFRRSHPRPPLRILR